MFEKWRIPKHDLQDHQSMQRHSKARMIGIGTAAVVEARRDISIMRLAAQADNVTSLDEGEIYMNLPRDPGAYVASVQAREKHLANHVRIITIEEQQTTHPGEFENA